MPADSLTQTTGRLSHSGATDTPSHQDMLLAAYEGYWDLQAAGDQVALDEYCARFPELRSSLPNLLRAHEFIDEHQSKLAAAQEEMDCSWPQAGEVFLEFELRRELGRGAFSRVYLATQPALGGRWVAVKLYTKPMGEARILGPLAHANIVPINSLQVDQSRRMAAICMPYAGSSTLQRLLDLIGKDGPPPRARVILHAAEDTAAPQQLKDQLAKTVSAEILLRGSYVEGVCHLGLQLADALAFIHKRGIFHRDLKPSNVLLKPDGQPMLLDFNLSDEADKPVARMGGTLPYMSPEQLRAWWLCHQDAERLKALPKPAASEDGTVQLQPTAALQKPQVAASADIFSLGVLLYELLTGKHPYGPIPVKVSVEELHKLIHERQQRGFQPLRAVNPAVDAPLAALVQRCLELDPAARPESADEVVHGLRDRLEKSRRRRVRRNRWIVAAACAFFLAAGTAGAFIGHLFRGDSAAQMQDALTWARKGDHKRAIDKITEILTQHPENFEARFLRGRLYQQLSLFDPSHLNSAVADYKLLDGPNADGRVLACLGFCRQSMKQISWAGGAIECYHRAIESHYDSPALRNNLGRAYAVDGKWGEAKTHFDAALERNPKLQTALYNRASNSLNLFHKSRSDQRPNEQHLYDGMKDVADALKLGATAELYETGAMLHAVAARQQPKEIPQALAYLSEAIKLGSAVKLNDSAYQAVSNLAAFHQLSKKQPAEKSPPMPRILDPINLGDAPY